MESPPPLRFVANKGPYLSGHIVHAITSLVAISIFQLAGVVGGMGGLLSGPVTCSFSIQPGPGLPLIDGRHHPKQQLGAAAVSLCHIRKEIYLFWRLSGGWARFGESWREDRHQPLGMRSVCVDCIRPRF